jgi:hypothetical protein
MKLKINFHEYSSHCGDGCCFDYGMITTVNGKELPAHNTDTGTIVSQILEHLGYEVEITYEEDNQ